MPKHRIKKWHLTITVVGLLAATILVYQAYFKFYIPFQVQQQRSYPVHGIDVSHHQHSIDWSSVKHAALAFAYIKATEGATYQDTSFTTNWNGARDNQLLPGAYHFFTFCRSGADQASNYLTALSRVKQRYPSLPPAVDIELEGNCPLTLTQEQLTVELSNFLYQVHQVTGCKPVIYTTEKFYNAYLAADFSRYPLWLRSLHQPPSAALNGQWKLWQYTHSSKVQGIETLVDQNVFYGSHQQFKAMHCQPLTHQKLKTKP